VKRWQVKFCAALCLLGGLGGCQSDRSGLYARFQDENPSVRLEAVREAGRTGDPAAVSYLIDRLTDSEDDVRFFAILTLERIADLPGDRRLGYRYYDPPARRAEAVERWRKWLADNHAKLASAPSRREEP